MTKKTKLTTADATAIIRKMRDKQWNAALKIANNDFKKAEEIYHFVCPYCFKKLLFNPDKKEKYTFMCDCKHFPKQLRICIG